MAETFEIRMKRLTMRSSRRGIKEMDLILGGFAATEMNKLSAAELDIYEDFLEENDHDLYQWTSRKSAAPQRYLGLVTRIAKSIENLNLTGN